MQDLLAALAPKGPRYSSYEGALAAVNELLAAELAGAGGSTSLGALLEGSDSDEEDAAGRRARKAAARDAEQEEASSSGAAGGSDRRGSEAGSEKSDLTAGDAAALRPSAMEVDEDFEREFAALMAESTGLGKGGATPPLSGAMSASSSASNLRSLSTVGGGSTVAVVAAADGRGGGGMDGDAAAPQVAFRVLSKKSGKDDRSREVQMPLSAAMAASLRKHVDQEAAERSAIKALVLAANQRDEEEARAAARAGRGGGRGGRGGAGRQGGPQHKPHGNSGTKGGLQQAPLGFFDL